MSKPTMMKPSKTEQVKVAEKAIEEAQARVAEASRDLDECRRTLFAGQAAIVVARQQRDADVPRIVVEGTEYIVSRRTKTSIWLRQPGCDAELRFKISSNYAREIGKSRGYFASRISFNLSLLDGLKKD